MSKQYYKQLDGLRCLAVCGVLIAHTLYLPVLHQIDLGFWGVNLFFVISGFLITEILMRQISAADSAGTILKAFYIKRTLRIFPIYYLVIIFAYAIDLASSRSIAGYTFTYTLNFYHCFTGNVNNALSHIWSLCVEEQFYIIWPFLLLVVKPRHWLKLIMSAIMLSVLLRVVIYMLHFERYDIYNSRMMPMCMDAMGMGALLAYMKLYRAEQLVRILKMYFIPIISAAIYISVAFLGSNMLNGPEGIWTRLLVAVCSFFLIGNVLQELNNGFGRFLENRVVQYIGRISYGVYLYHLVIYFLLRGSVDVYLTSASSRMPAFVQHHSYLITTPLCYVITFVVAALSYQFIEKPFLKLKNKIDSARLERENVPGEIIG